MKNYEYYDFHETIKKYHVYSYEFFEKNPEIEFTEDMAPPELKITDSIPDGAIYKCI